MSEDLTDEAVNFSSPLSADLATKQVELLKILWAHMIRTAGDPDGPAWPVWRYVDAVFSREHRDGTSSIEVLDSLPGIPRDPQSGADYGLVWWTESAGESPLPTARIGLSIAGLTQLGRHAQNSAGIADALAAIVAAVAADQVALPPDPYKVPIINRSLSDYIGEEFRPTRDHPFEIPEVLIGELLQHEYVALRLGRSASSFTLNLGGLSLSAYVGIGNAADYIDLITRDSEADQPSVHVAPLPLIPTIDYLSYVLADDPEWKRATTRRLAEAPDLASAAALATPATTRDQFESNIGALWNLISNFCIPKGDPVEMESLYGADGVRGSLNQLDWWLRGHLDDAAYGRTNIALAAIRDIGKIRNGAAHSSADKRRLALQAQKRLHIPAIITQWNDAWETIKGTLSGALDVIREEVQQRPRERRN